MKNTTGNIHYSEDDIDFSESYKEEEEKKVFLDLRLHSVFKNNEDTDEAEEYFKQNVLPILDEHFGNNFKPTIWTGKENFYWSVPIYALRWEIINVGAKIIKAFPDKIISFTDYQLLTEKL